MSRIPYLALALLLALTSPAFAQRDLKDIPDPDPEIERKSFIVPDDLEVNLYAADPLLAKPIQMNFDAQGRLWIASSEVYPQIKPGQQATDKILVLEDTNFDGTADKTTVFADGLLIPTAVIPDDLGGAYVANSTELLYLKDTDGDLKADERRIVLSGFGTEDTHHLLHTFRWGPDGCLYMNQSIYIHSHVETPHGVKRLNGGGIWRFRPETLELEVLCYGFVNSWGHHIDRWGQSFATDGAYGEGINYVFPGSVFVTAPGAKRIVAGLHPGSPKHCGLEIVSGRHFPPEWDGNMITNDFRAHRVCRFVITEDGSGYASRQEVEPLKSSHVAFRPIDAKMGPDGALYIADWYNPIIQHGEVDFRDPRRDQTRGRIWRITYKGRPTLDTRIPADETVPALLERLKSSEQWVRQHAKNMLKARDKEEVLAALPAWIAKLDADDENWRLEALWVYECLDTLSEELLARLASSSDHRARAAAVRTAAHWQAKLADPVKYFQAAVADEHPRVRLEGVRALTLLPTLESTRLAATVLDKPMDRWLDFAVWQAMRDLAPVWLPAVQEGRFDFGGNVEHLTYALKAVESPDVVQPLLKLIQDDQVPADRVQGVLELIATLGGPKELGAVLDMVVAGDSKLSDERKAALLTALVETTRLRKTKPVGDLNRIGRFFESRFERPHIEPLRVAAIRASGAWKVEGTRKTISAWFLHRDSSPAIRAALFEATAAYDDAESQDWLAACATLPDMPWPDRQVAAAALATIDVPRAVEVTVELLANAPDGTDLGVAVTAIASRRGGPEALTRALADARLKPDTAKLVLRAVRAAPQPSDELVAAIQTAGNLSTGWKLTPELLAELIEEVQSKGDPARGEALYRTASLQCLKCHAIGGAGGLVGPDMTSIGGSAQIDYLIESLIDPAAKVKENYHSKVVLDLDGQITTGIPVRETPQEIVLRDAEDKLVTIAKPNIDQIKDGRSLMPDGLLDSLTRQELVDLTAFLSRLGKVGGGYAVSSEPLVRRWEVLTYSNEANRRLNRTSFDTAAGDDPAFVWSPAYSRVAGDLPLDDLPTFKPHANLEPTTFVRFEVEVSTPGRASIAFGNPTDGASTDTPHGLALWLNGKPTPLSSNTATLDLPAGRHRLTLAIDRTAHPHPLRVLVTGETATVQVVGGK